MPLVWVQRRANAADTASMELEGGEGDGRWAGAEVLTGWR